MDIRHLELLRELADRGSIAAVAAATYRTPSAVSQQVKAAERSLGVRLIEPSGRGVRLTPAGQVLAEQAVAVAAAVAGARDALDRFLGVPTGIVSMAGLPSASELLLGGVLTRLGQTIAVEFTDLDASETEFAAGVADVDIVLGHLSPFGPEPSGVLRVPLASEPLDLALPAGHRLASQGSVDASQLGGQPWVSVPEGYPFDRLRTAIEAAAGAPVDVRLRAKDNRLVESLVVAGIGLALLPRFSTRPRPGMVTRPLTGVRAVREIVALARPERAERAAVRVVLDVLRDVGGGLAGPEPTTVP